MRRGYSMRKCLDQAPVVYCIFLVCMSAASAAFYALGYRFAVANELVWFILHAAAVAALTVLCVIKRTNATKSSRTIAQFLPLLSLVYACSTSVLVQDVSDLFVTGHALLCFVSCFVVSLLYAERRGIQVLSIVLNSSLLAVISLVSSVLTMIGLTFGQIGENTVVRQVPSPSNAYTAIVIDSDQGALGGNTFVDVAYRAAEINLGVGRLVREKRLYSGDWMAFETMTLAWEDERTLSINGEAYSIDFKLSWADDGELP